MSRRFWASWERRAAPKPSQSGSGAVWFCCSSAATLYPESPRSKTPARSRHHLLFCNHGGSEERTREVIAPGFLHFEGNGIREVPVEIAGSFTRGVNPVHLVLFDLFEELSEARDLVKEFPAELRLSLEQRRPTKICRQ